MRFFLFHLIFLASLSSLAKVHINDPKVLLKTEERIELIGAIEKAVLYFQTFKSFDEDVFVNINTNSCLRTSYNYKTKQITFCKTNNTIRMGLESIDIINHEVFHYLYCHSFPHNCTAEKISNHNIQSFHEGMADFFAYKMNSDNFFGENFRTDIPYLRTYKNDLCFRYAYSAHQRGSALASTLIHNNSEFLLLNNFLDSMSFEDLIYDSCLNDSSLKLVPEHHKVSSRNKYWIKLHDTITFKFKLEEEYSLATESLKNLFSVVKSDGKITFKSKGIKGFEKFNIYILKEDKIVGETRIYLGAR